MDKINMAVDNTFLKKCARLCKSVGVFSLGIILNWTSHIENICRKLNTILYVIKQIQAISDIATAKGAYFILYFKCMHERYGLAVWSATSAANLVKIILVKQEDYKDLKHSNQDFNNCWTLYQWSSVRGSLLEDSI